MKGKLYTTLRVLFGLMLGFFGANQFFRFMTPPPMGGAADTLLAALMGSGYIFEIKGLVYLATGVLLLWNKAIPFAMTLLAPISVNITAFHLALSPATGGGAYVITLLNAYFAYKHKDAYKDLFA